jgi:hypothetical protein
MEKDRQTKERQQHQEDGVCGKATPSCRLSFFYRARDDYNFGFANSASRARRWTTADE